MPEIMFTPGGNHITTVRSVPDTPYTAGGNPAQVVMIGAGPLPPEPSLSPGGHPFVPVRFVDAAGNYTTSTAAIATQPEIMFTPDGNPIVPVRIVAASEISLTPQGFPVLGVWRVDAAGVKL